MRQFIVFVIEHNIGVKLDEKQSVKEIETKLGASVKEWEEENKSEGIQEGIEKGRQEGLMEGETSLLKMQLTQRFGPLPDWELVKIHNADQNMVVRWGLKFLDANNLEEVFDFFD